MAKQTRDREKGRGERICVFTPKFIEDLTYWVSGNAKVATRLLELVEAIRRSPFDGIGKPEPLKHVGSNTWSRRLTQSERVVYMVEHDRVVFLMGRYHY